MGIDVIGERNAVIVAHPDDEVLWCGGLIARHADRAWTVFCCSSPSGERLRGLKFYDSCSALGAVGRLLPFPEGDLSWLENLDLGGFDAIVTHGRHGEHGHPGHRELHRHLVKLWGEKKQMLFFGQQLDGKLSGDRLILTPGEEATKRAALACYDYVDARFPNQPRWRSILEYREKHGYRVGVESFER